MRSFSELGPGRRLRVPGFPCAAILGAALLSVSCIGLHQYRTETVIPDGDDGYVDKVCEESLPNDSSDDRCAVEQRSYTIGEHQNGEETVAEATYDYYFASVEFDDRGWFWDRSQMETLLRFLYGKSDEEFLIFAYAHGWQHNADPCDNNTVCFQRLLERLDYAQQVLAKNSGNKARKVVGVYIGWRGRIGKNKPARLLSFFNRKGAANRVGIGGVTELLTRLDDLRGFKNPGRDAYKTQLAITGHSFGGQVIYKALSHSLIERAVAMGATDKMRREDGVEVAGAYGYGVARSFGDLVLLVNPAFEGAAYEALQFAATNRCYPASQRPSLVIVTSTADGATGSAFPKGRRLSDGLSDTRCADQKQAVLKTVGHLPRYTSHVLELRGPPKAPPPKDLREEPCGCPYLEPIDEEFALRANRDMEFLAEKFRVANLRRENPGKIYEMGHEEALPSIDAFRWASYGENSLGEEMILRRVADDPGKGYSEYAANYPYLVVQTDEYFIPSHSLIYGERFTDFIRRFFLRHLVGRAPDKNGTYPDDLLTFPQQCYSDVDELCLKTDITPCERSWTRRPDVACRADANGDPQGR